MAKQYSKKDMAIAKEFKKCKISKKDLQDLNDFERYGIGEMPGKLRKVQGKWVGCILKGMKKIGEL